MQRLPLVSWPAPPATPAGYAEVFTTRGRWGGGDCGPTIRLPDGRVLWVFGDTWLDPNPDGSLCPLVHSTLVVQTGGAFELVIGDGDTAALPDPGPGQWSWVTAGGWATADAVHVVANRMAATTGNAWGFEIVGAQLLTLDPATWETVAVLDLPAPPGWAWNGGCAVVDSLAYLWGWNGAGTVVARMSAAAPSSTLFALWAGGAMWSRSLPAAAPVALEDPVPFIPVKVEAAAGGFVASGQLVGGLAEPVRTWWAPSPTGPFRHVGAAADTTEAGVFTYEGRVTALPGAGLTAVWSAGPDGSGPYDTRRYGLRFGACSPAGCP